jgi:hypothetical protein
MSDMPDNYQWNLPHLILHPFSSANDATRLAESTQANLMLKDLLPRRDIPQEVLEDRVLDGRYREIRWLFYIGRDVVRWIDQCLDFARSHDDLSQPDLRFQTFAALLTENPPQSVKDKLHRWGVLDFKRVFSRAIGINTLFAQFPAFELLSEEFLREYYAYADSIFACRQDACNYLKLDGEWSQFEIYTSGEYSSILERGLRDSP